MSKITLPGRSTAACHRFRNSPERPLALLSQCPAYRPTPMRNMPDLARELNLKCLWIKDETSRMQLGSFKALGGAFAIAQIIAEAAGTTDLTANPVREIAAGMTFITASAGNHGLSVAAGARIFGARAVIVLSSSVPESFADRIRAGGGTVVRINGTYEDSVENAREQARVRGWLHVADGSWEGYVERPALVMEGYTVIADECLREFARSNRWPTHVFIQAGVGGLAASVASHVRSHWPEQPAIVVVEPEAAPCLKASVESGKLVRAEGEVSNMGRLDCKDASLIAFESLRHDADRFVTVTDRMADCAATRLAEAGIETTPSGSAGLAALCDFPRTGVERCLLVVTEGVESQP